MSQVTIAKISADQSVNSSENLLIRYANQDIAATTVDRPARRRPDMWSELFVGAVGMTLVVGLMYLLFS
jgi:hypothetical protein